MKQIIISILAIISIFDFKNLSSMKFNNALIFKEEFRESTQARYSITQQNYYKNYLYLSLQIQSFYCHQNIWFQGKDLYSEQIQLNKEFFYTTIKIFKSLQRGEKIIYLYQLKRIWEIIQKEHFPIPGKNSWASIRWHKKAINYLIKKMENNSSNEFHFIEKLMLILIHANINLIQVYPNIASKIAFKMSFLLKPRERIFHYHANKKAQETSSIQYQYQELIFYKKHPSEHKIKYLLRLKEYWLENGDNLMKFNPDQQTVIKTYIEFERKLIEQKLIFLHQIKREWKKNKKKNLYSYQYIGIRWHQKASGYLLAKIENEPSNEFTFLEKIMLYAIINNKEQELIFQSFYEYITS